MDIALYFIILVAFSVAFTLEVIAPASGAACNKRWQIYAGIISLIQIAATVAAGILFRKSFEEISLFNMSASYSAPIVGAVSFFVASFVAYWWHRAMHKYNLLWRVFHQLHHSP
jgi:sterol desaturase/sphingolipid hydroxylase (fatty acid hydroxylase superfamily)